MIRIRGLLLAGLLALPAGGARAACDGPDYLARLEASNPALTARIDARVEAAPFARGRFWRIERDGRVSHAFGTFHTADPALAALPPGPEAALEAARRVLVEVLPEEKDRMQQIMAAEPQRLMNLSGPPLAERLSAAEMRRLDTLLAPYGLNAEAANMLQPWFLNMLLATPACVLEDITAGAPVLDDRIIGAARARGVPVQGLETIEASIDIFAGLAPEDQLRLLRMNIAVGELSEPVMVATERLYAEGRIWRIWLLNRALAADLGLAAELGPILDAFYEQALVSRNRAWLPAIEAALAEGGVLIAVGALHLAGPDSLQAMLERRGWRVTRLDPHTVPEDAAARPAAGEAPE